MGEKEGGKGGEQMYQRKERTSEKKTGGDFETKGWRGREVQLK